MPQCEKTDSLHNVLYDILNVLEGLHLMAEAQEPASQSFATFLERHLKDACARLDILTLQQRCDEAMRPRREKEDTDMVNF